MDDISQPSNHISQYLLKEQTSLHLKHVNELTVSVPVTSQDMCMVMLVATVNCCLTFKLIHMISLSVSSSDGCSMQGTLTGNMNIKEVFINQFQFCIKTKTHTVSNPSL
jgi:hypothetical protein